METKKDKLTAMEHEEWLILQVELHIQKLMDDQGISRVELARRLGTTKGYVSQLFDGKNLSLRTVARVLAALDSSLVIDTGSLGFETTLKAPTNTEKQWAPIYHPGASTNSSRNWKDTGVA